MSYCSLCKEYFSFEEECENKYCRDLKKLIKKYGVEKLCYLIKKKLS